LGDLNGGMIMRRRLAGCLGPVAHRLMFHDYPALDDVDAFKRDYRVRLNRAVGSAMFETVAREAVVAFEMNIAISEAVKWHSA